MYTELVNDALTEYSYDASLAGLDYSFGSYDRGVYLSASGYNEKVRLLTQSECCET
jgi:insulysin